jgi:hypothetical protein
MEDKICEWIAYKFPRRVVYFCAIRLGAETTTGKFSNTIVPEVEFMTCLKRWEEKGE